MTQASTDQLVWMWVSPKYALRSGLRCRSAAGACAAAGCAWAAALAGAGGPGSFQSQTASAASATMPTVMARTRRFMATAPLE